MLSNTIATIHNCLLNTWNAVIVINNWILTFSFNYAFLVAQTIKNSPAMWETWVQSLSQEDPLEKGMATCREPAWGIPPVTRSCGKSSDGKANHTSGFPSGISWASTPKARICLLYYVMLSTYSSVINRALSPHHLFLEKVRAFR